MNRFIFVCVAALLVALVPAAQQPSRNTQDVPVEKQWHPQGEPGSVNKKTSAPVVPAPASDARVKYVVYFTSTYNDLKTAQDRLNASGHGVAVAMRDLNGIGGMRQITNGDLADLAKHLPGGQKEAESLKAIIEDGWHLLVIMSPDESQWSSPTILSPYLDIYTQIASARTLDKKSNPQRYAPQTASRTK